jgi:osmotically-inducible protein OsmY
MPPQTGGCQRGREVFVFHKFRSHWRLVLITVASCGMIACTTQPPRSAAQKEADDATTQRVQAALTAQTNTNFSKVDVSTYDGVVHLGGLVWASQDIYAAARVAGTVPGVKSVTNNIQLVSSQFGR